MKTEGSLCVQRLGGKRHNVAHAEYYMYVIWNLWCAVDGTNGYSYCPPSLDTWQQYDFLVQFREIESIYSFLKSAVALWLTLANRMQQKSLDILPLLGACPATVWAAWAELLEDENHVEQSPPLQGAHPETIRCKPARQLITGVWVNPADTRRNAHLNPAQSPHWVTSVIVI